MSRFNQTRGHGRPPWSGSHAAACRLPSDASRRGTRRLAALINSAAAIKAPDKVPFPVATSSAVDSKGGALATCAALGWVDARPTPAGGHSITSGQAVWKS
jgi:hypothetical protein